MNSRHDHWGPEDSPALIAQLVTAQTNQRLAELTLFARAVAEHADEGCQQAMARAMQLARALPPGALAAAFSEPEFHYWSYIAQCLRGRLQNGEAIPASDTPHLAGVPGYAEAPLLIHILDLNRFLLAAAIMAGAGVSCSVPVHDHELVIPGLGILIDLASPRPTVDLDFSWEEECRLAIDSQALSEFADGVQAALIKSGGYQRGAVQVLPWVRMSTGAFIVNGLDPYYRHCWVTSYRNADGSRYGEVPRADYGNWQKTLAQAVQLLADCWPDMESDIGQGLRSVIPVKSPAASVHMSCSKDVMSFALLMSAGTPVMLAEAFIHEFGHNVLNAITEFDDVFAEPRRPQCDLYSPWRPDPRPLSGVLHAVYVFERVCEFYTRYLSRDSSEEIAHRFRLMTIRNLIALETLASVIGSLGTAGLKLMMMLNSRVQKHALTLTEHDWAKARGELVTHYSKWLEDNPSAQEPNSQALIRLIDF